jgi:hypothetical protein
MSSALTVLMQRALFELNVGFVVPNADISAIAAGTFTAARFFNNTNMSQDFLQTKQTGFVRAGAATAADFWRPAGTLVNSSGVMSQVGPSWADTTVGSEEIEVWYYGVRRDQEALRSLNRVTIKEFITTYLALSHLSGLDGDMALSTDTNWTDVGTTSTSAKAVTAAVTPWGQRSYHTVNNAVANSGTRSASIRVRTSGQVIAHTIAASEVGTSSIQGYDATGSAVFGTAVTSAERRPQLLTFQGNVPSTSKLWAVNLTNTSSTGDTYWNQAWAFDMDNPVCPLPALLTESFMAPKIIQGVPRYSTGSGAYDAESFDFRTLVEGIDYWLVVAPADAVPYKVRFADNSYYQWPLFVEARIPLSSLTTFAAETDSTTGPLERLVARFKKDLLETVYNTGSRKIEDWTFQHNLATEQLTQASMARPVKSVANPKPWWSPRLSAS